MISTANESTMQAECGIVTVQPGEVQGSFCSKDEALEQRAAVLGKIFQGTAVIRGGLASHWDTASIEITLPSGVVITVYQAWDDDGWDTIGHTMDACGLEQAIQRALREVTP